MKRALRITLIATVCTLIGTLLWHSLNTDPHVARWQDYLERLSRLTNMSVPDPSPVALLPYPPRRVLRHALPEHRINLLDFLELRHCDLMELVSQRNSALGKLQADSLRLQHEVAFIRQARACLDGDSLNNPELTQLLEQVIRDKQASLPQLHWNALAAGPELRRFFSLSPSARAGNTPGALASLDFLVASGSDGQIPEMAQLKQWEGHLETLVASQAGGVLLQRQALALQSLNQANQMLASLDPAALCPRNRASTRARRLRNVLDNIWGPTVQRALAEAVKQRRALADALATLASHPAAVPDLIQWQAYYFGPDGREARLDETLGEHVRLWQSRLRPCGLMPGQT